MVTVNVDNLSSHDFESELKDATSESALVFMIPGGLDLHSVYVKDYDSLSKMVTCMNSHGQHDQYPMIRFQDINHLYRIKCSAVSL